MSRPLVPQASLDSVIATAVAKVFDGCRLARAAGNLVKYPDFVDVEVIMLVDVNAITREQVSTQGGEATVTVTDAPATTTRTTTPSPMTTVSTRSGGDGSTQQNTYAYYDEGGGI